MGEQDQHEDAPDASPRPVMPEACFQHDGERAVRHDLGAPCNDVRLIGACARKSSGEQGEGAPAPVMLAARAAASPSASAAAWLIVPNGPLRAAIDGRALAVIALCCLVATAASAATTAANGERSALEVIWLWAPLLLKGFVFNLVISALAMIVGTIAGLPLGVLQSSTIAPVRWIARFATQFFRNSPWLVLLFLCVLLLPFQIRIFGLTHPVARLGQGHPRLLAAGHGQRVGDRARRACSRCRPANGSRPSRSASRARRR